MGGIGSGRRPKDKGKAKEKKKSIQLERPAGRLFSGPEHVEEIRTSSAIRFKG